jgi:DNA-binding transcriptional LysR family regulator
MELRPSRYALTVRDDRPPNETAVAGQNGSRHEDGDGKDGGSLAVGFAGTALTAVLPEALTAFGRRRPRVRLELVEAPAAEQIAQLLAGHLDVGFFCGPVPGPAREHLMSVSLTRDRLVAAVPDGSPLTWSRPGAVTGYAGPTPLWADHGGQASGAAGNGHLHRHLDQPSPLNQPLPLAALAGQPLILSSRQAEPAMAGAALAMCRTAGFEPITVIEASGPHTLLGLVACGLGVGIGPESMGRLRHEGVTLLELTPPAPVVTVRMVHRAAAAGPALRDFRRTVQAVCP